MEPKKLLCLITGAIGLIFSTFSLISLFAFLDLSAFSEAVRDVAQRMDNSDDVQIIASMAMIFESLHKSMLFLSITCLLVSSIQIFIGIKIPSAAKNS